MKTNQQQFGEVTKASFGAAWLPRVFGKQTYESGSSWGPGTSILLWSHFYRRCRRNCQGDEPLWGKHRTRRTVAALARSQLASCLRWRVESVFRRCFRHGTDRQTWLAVVLVLRKWFEPHVLRTRWPATVFFGFWSFFISTMRINFLVNNKATTGCSRSVQFMMP